jgi:hypothetical protein
MVKGDRGKPTSITVYMSWETKDKVAAEAKKAHIGANQWCVNVIERALDPNYVTILKTDLRPQVVQPVVKFQNQEVKIVEEPPVVDPLRMYDETMEPPCHNFLRGIEVEVIYDKAKPFIDKWGQAQIQHYGFIDGVLKRIHVCDDISAKLESCRRGDKLCVTLMDVVTTRSGRKFHKYDVQRIG